MTYLSIAPNGLREAFLTGGLSPIGRPVDDIYGATYRRLLDKNRAYYARYPDDRARIAGIIRRLKDEDIRLPSGDRLTARRFRQLGLWLGDSAGFELLHDVLELPFGQAAFLHDVEGGVRFGRNPIYATVHESSYADGGATRWSAHRLLPDEIVAEGFFTAEHVFPWMCEDYATLRPQRAAAELLAEHTGPALHCGPQLRRNDVPAAATIYANDLYVERDFAEETARTIRGLRTWETDVRRIYFEEVSLGRDRPRSLPGTRVGWGSAGRVNSAGRCQRRGLEVSRAITPLASRSSWTALDHHPARAPPGNRSAGSLGRTASRIWDSVKPGAFSGRTARSASRMAVYMPASTEVLDPG